MQTNLYFVRHAHSTYTPDELGRALSERGVFDAERITQMLEQENIDIVISSSYKRAIQTVEGIAKFIGREIIIEDDFKERKLSEEPVKDFNLAITKVWEEPSFSWEGGESNIIAQKRGVEATLNILEQYIGKNIAVGTHGNLMVLIMNYFDHGYDFTFWKELDMPDIYKLTFENKKLIEVNRIWERF
ncbi:2,3-bisphosphoglycerate-dependent phosphoglycerate mutase [Psychrobacillus sp. OK028]|uniref:histidine phosphatase family protein n=1 Tax=Psychrobacillus sp. OK028 TaxID=1884359 RepID=UPI00088019F4|nr:histidine phosphatase family protein [Psychrobacillus sp. OK028]SDM89138.1 2,3-bisphosphoglycerate-dependent phosphoglycerate mutase [Psychrobacillus sp. OK028]